MARTGTVTATRSTSSQNSTTRPARRSAARASRRTTSSSKAGTRRSSCPSPRGGRDLNGDGDVLDGVLHVYDERADRRFSTGLALYGSYARDGSLSAFRVLESVQGEDLNGDGDLADEFAYVLDLSRAPARR